MQKIRRISLLNVIDKVYSKVLIDPMPKISDGMIGDEQGGFRPDREGVE